MEIGFRLAEMRTFLRYSQYDVATRLNITRERLSSYESGRLPVKASVALAFCCRYNVSERWLAIGTPPKHPCLYNNIPLHLLNLRPNALFSYAYDHALAGGEAEAMRFPAKYSLVEDHDIPEYWRTFALCVIDDAFKKMSPSEASVFFQTVLKAAVVFLKSKGIAIYDDPYGTALAKEDPKT